MNKKFYILGILIFFALQTLSAQKDYFYYYNNQKVYIDLDVNSVTITTDLKFKESSISDLKFKPFELKYEYKNLDYKYSTIEYEKAPSIDEYFKNLVILNSNSQIIKAHPNFTNKMGEKLGLSNYIYIRLKNETDYDKLKDLTSKNHISIVGQNPFMPLWYTLELTKESPGNALEMANLFYETGFFASSQPDFLSDDLIQCTNDPNFGDLWGLYNSSNTNYDINACQAWNITEGTNVVVAVLDQGIEKTHSDLHSNIYHLSYNSETGTSPSQLFSYHGTHCAGTIAAIKNNNNQVVGVAPKAKLMDISNSFLSSPGSRMARAEGIDWAWINGAHVISNSWGSSVRYDVIDEAISNALTYGRNNKGTVVVFASGNNYNSYISYPADCNPNILAIGSITSSGVKSGFSNYGTGLDVVAPGSDILSTMPNNSISFLSGTSMATPHVAGVAALILSVNPYLTVKDVNNIIEQTAQKINPTVYTYSNHDNRPNGTWNNEMGYGLVDAYAAVQLARELYSSTLDLYIKDRHEDLGISGGYNINAKKDNSPDIWVRNQRDGFSNTEHQNPEYNPYSPVYVYVRVRNKSAVPSTGGEKLSLYWTKAAGWSSWPQNWDGTQPDKGNVIGSTYIGNIPPGGERIYEFTWNIDLEGSVIIEEGWGQCLLARIENSIADPITIYPNRLDHDVYYNNNIAWKNLMIVDMLPNVRRLYPCAYQMYIGNPTSEYATMNIEFSENTTPGLSGLTNETEVKLYFESKGWDRLKDYFIKNKDVKILKDGEVLLLSKNVTLKDIVIPPENHYPISVEFKYISSKLTEQNQFMYHVQEYFVDKTDAQLIGGVHFMIEKPDNISFVADAGKDLIIKEGEAVILEAVLQKGDYIYRWYDNGYNLLHEGINYEIAPQTTTTYILEVEAEYLCALDRTAVNVQVISNYIENIYPNPVESEVNISYRLKDVKSSYLTIINQLGTVYKSYPINISQNSKTINIKDLTPGSYIIQLVSDGVIYDAKSLIKK